MSVVGGLFHVDSDSGHVPGCSLLPLRFPFSSFAFDRSLLYTLYTASENLEGRRILQVSKEKFPPRSRTLRLSPLP